MAIVKETVELDEYELFTRYQQTKDPALRDTLVSAYLYIAEILSHKFLNRGVDYEDVYQVACLGLVYAVERFNPELGLKFSTFATPTVMGELRRYFRDKGNFIKIPRRLYNIFFKAEKIRRSLAPDKCSREEIARALNLPVEVVQEAYDLEDPSFIQSLEHEALGDGNMTLSHVLGQEDNHFIMVENKDFVKYCLSQLSEKEQEFVKKRFYEERSQKEIAAGWNVSQMNVCRFEKKVLKKLRNLYFRD